MKRQFLFFFVTVCFFSCGKSSDSSSSVTDVSGNWHGTLVAASNANANGTFIMTINQNGTTLSGTLATTTYCCTAGPYNFTGSISGNTIQLTYSGNNGKANLNATISGKTFTGSFNETNGVLGFNAAMTTGTWQGTNP